MTFHPLRVVNEGWIFHFPQLLVLSSLDYSKKFQGIWLGGGVKQTVASHLFPGSITQTSNSIFFMREATLVSEWSKQQFLNLPG